MARLEEIDAKINAIRTAEHPEQPQSEPERKPVRLIDANSIKYTTRTIEHSQDGAPPVTFAYKEDIDKLPTVDTEELEIVQSLRKLLKSRGEILSKTMAMLSRAETEKEAALNELDKLRREFERYKNRGLISRILNEEAEK